MRIPEKTIELNFCAQVTAVLQRRVIWFGPTQKQEAQLGFDACTKLGGRLLIFQFKASNIVLRNGARRFNVPHQQIVALQRLKSFQRSTFYVLPSIGTSLEFVKSPNILMESWLMDVASLPHPMGLPTKRNGSARRSAQHHIYLKAGSAVIRSEPRNVPVILAQDFFSEGMPGSHGLAPTFGRSFEEFWAIRNYLGRSALGLLALND